MKTEIWIIFLLSYSSSHKNKLIRVRWTEWEIYLKWMEKFNYISTHRFERLFVQESGVKNHTNWNLSERKDRMTKKNIDHTLRTFKSAIKLYLIKNKAKFF